MQEAQAAALEISIAERKLGDDMDVHVIVDNQNAPRRRLVRGNAARGRRFVIVIVSEQVWIVCSGMVACLHWLTLGQHGRIVKAIHDA
ncbi:hypothetical protein GCM10008020_23130 [Massilia psychrophila]|nr:hypothetical protein GCM10008020_23130 [Massilia psychrophila]